MKLVLLAAALAKPHQNMLQKRQLTMVGGCSTGPGANQTVGYTTNGTVAGVAPHTQVLKDGFWYVGCLSDAMQETGDKFGDNAVQYAQQSSANTSIVRYDTILERENQEPMTPQVCFDFCRSIPDMQFFSLIHGRECYCEHYYKKQPGNGACDQPCEGESSSICGGQGMSSVYQMHSCEGGLLQDAVALENELYDLDETLDETYAEVDEAAVALQESGEALEALAEGSSSSLAQAAKVAAGPIGHAAEDLDALLGEFSSLNEDFGALGIELGGELTFAERKQLEKFMADSEDLMDASEQALAAAVELFKEVSPPDAEDLDAGATYVPVMRQIDPEKEALMSVCNGELTGVPMVGVDYDGCAMACDNGPPKSSPNHCWAFQYFTFPNADPLCFHFSSLSELTSYNCDLVEESLVQKPKLFLQKAVAVTEKKKHHKKHKKHRHHKKDGEKEARRVEPETEPKAEAAPAKAEVKEEPKAEVKATEPEAKVEAKPVAVEAKVEAKPEAKAEAKPVAVEAKPFAAEVKKVEAKAAPTVTAAPVKVRKLTQTEVNLKTSVHPSTYFVMQKAHALHFHSGKRSNGPTATCAVRFADVNGVTPTLKDGITNIDRCFGSD
jgi:hypothetical protein